MIREKYSTKSNPMTRGETFDEFYSRKLYALIVQLKDIIKGDIPCLTGTEYACRVCSGRIKLYSQARIYCIICQEPAMWSYELKAQVFLILQSYPSYDESMQEWQEKQDMAPVRRVWGTGKPVVRTGNAELGARIREARIQCGLSREDLGRKIDSRQGGKLTGSAIKMYEIASCKPSKKVLAQLEQILGIEG